MADESELDQEPIPDSAAGGDLQSLLKRAMASEDEPPKVDVLEGVQQKLRDRSGGKFYADGWSTSRHPPFSTYFITSLMMLAIVVIIYAIVAPLAGDPVSAPTEPQPVRVVPPR